MSTRTALTPSLFISHGAPTFAVEPGELGAKLAQLGPSLTGARAVVVVSPHWQTQGLNVSSHPRPETIHDFHGFPDALYKLRYPAAGDPEIAQMVVALLKKAGLQAQLDEVRGLDHGVWVPLLHLRPQADIPVICVSLPIDATPQSAWELGQALAPLRERQVVVLGSGSLTHNLADWRGCANTEVASYVSAFTAWIRASVQARDLVALTAYRTRAPHAVRAHPSEEHLLPLFVTLGATDETDRFEVLTKEVRYGVLSMETFYWH